MSVCLHNCVICSDLNELQSDYTVSDGACQIPQGSQVGSRGTPLPTSASSPLIRNVTKVKLDLAQFKLGAGSENGVCSLEKLGIVPARMLGRGKFGSLMSLNYSFKTWYPPRPFTSSSQPVIIRAVLSGSPAALVQLRPGEMVGAQL